MTKERGAPLGGGLRINDGEFDDEHVVFAFVGEKLLDVRVVGNGRVVAKDIVTGPDKGDDVNKGQGDELDGETFISSLFPFGLLFRLLLLLLLLLMLKVGVGL